MIDTERIIRSFTGLGAAFSEASLAPDPGKVVSISDYTVLKQSIEHAYHHNPWFVPAFVRFAFRAWAEALREDKVSKWIQNYLPGDGPMKPPSRVGIIMAGNIPMVGLHDLLCVLASGNHALIRLSQSDDQLIPAVLELLYQLNPEFKNQITVTSGPLKNFDAVIATGSNNTSRYFDYYFGKYPSIVRRNRNGVAVISGNEAESDLFKLADDIFVYFGLGCRNISKIYIPEDYKVEYLLPFFEEYAYLSDLHKYRNNYDYQKSLLLINIVFHLDNGFLLVKEDTSLMSPISVLHTETYSSPKTLNKHLSGIEGQIQCIVSALNGLDQAIPFGQSQYPELWDYADGIDSMAFLMNLRKNE